MRENQIYSGAFDMAERNPVSEERIVVGGEMTRLGSSNNRSDHALDRTRRARDSLIASVGASRRLG